MLTQVLNKVERRSFFVKLQFKCNTKSISRIRRCEKFLDQYVKENQFHLTIFPTNVPQILYIKVTKTKKVRFLFIKRIRNLGKIFIFASKLGDGLGFTEFNR